MIKASESIVIFRPKEIVFNTAADPKQQLVWDKKHFTKLEALTPGPVAAGSKYKCVIPWMGTMWYEFTEYEPHTHFAHRSKMFVNYGYHHFEFISLPEGTQFVQTMQVWPRGIGYLLYPFMKILLKKSLRSVSTGLKSFLETPP
jgi:hypothetical protein